MNRFHGSRRRTLGHDSLNRPSGPARRVRNQPTPLFGARYSVLPSLAVDDGDNPLPPPEGTPDDTVATGGPGTGAHPQLGPFYFGVATPTTWLPSL
jgi:hypothetical protein